MSWAPNPGAPYLVVRSEVIRRQLQQWGEAAKRAGQMSVFVGTLQFVEEKMANEPLTWGDPVYQLPHLELDIHRGLHQFLVVEYGVHKSKRLVIVKQYRLLPNCPFEPL